MQQVTMVFLVAADTSGPDEPAVMRGWVIPGRLAAEFADYMTERFGKPQESVTSVGAMIAAGQGAPATYTIVSDGDG